MTASPISDLNPILLASECVVTFRTYSRSDRQVTMDKNFFTKYRTTCARNDEVLTEIQCQFNTKVRFSGL